MVSRTQPSTPNSVACRLCGTPTVHAFSKDGYTIVDCPACEHRMVADAVPDDHLDAVYGDSYFFGGGAGYDDYLSESKLLRAQGRRYGSLLLDHRRGGAGSLLDVGSAAGFVQAGLQDTGWVTTGLEPNATMVAAAKDELGLRAIQGSLERPPDLPPFDVVCLIQVIGHFNDLSKAMTSLASLTKPGGLCLVEYWRRESGVSRVLGPHWHEYSPPSVLHWFSRGSLDTLMKSTGFDVLARGAPKKYISLGHAASLLSHKLNSLPGGAVISAPLRLLPQSVTVRYPALDLEWRLYRKAN